MTHTEILKEMIRSLQTDIEAYLAGETAAYQYQKEHTERWGDIDSNYFNRKRLCYALFFGVCAVGEPQKEQMVRALFAEEILSREQESFQGIGENLELLTILMKPYRTPADDALYDRAKNANFDCFLGYNPEHPTEGSYQQDPECYDLYDCIYLAGGLQMTDYACRFVDIFKENGLDANGLKQLKRFAEYTRRTADTEQAVTGCFALFAHDENAPDFDRLNAYADMIDDLVGKEETAEAFSLLIEGTDILKQFNGRTFYEKTYAIMQADASMIRAVWDYAGKYALRELKSGNMYSVSYAVVRKCAELAGDKNVCKMIDKKHKDT